MIKDQRARMWFAIGVACTIRISGSMRRQTKMITISEHGVRLETLFRIRHNEPIWIDLGNYRNLACIASWSSASFTGLGFCSPMHPSLLNDFMAKQPSYYDLDFVALDEICGRAERESLRATTDIDADQLRLLGADCRRASIVNRLVQVMRNHDMGIDRRMTRSSKQNMTS